MKLNAKRLPKLLLPILIVSLSWSVPAQTPAQANRDCAAVIEFTKDPSVQDPNITGTAVAVLLEEALSSRYRLVTRAHINKMLQELQLSITDLVEAEKAQKFGKVVGARYIITGCIVQLGPRRITVAAQIFTVETGEIRQTAKVTAESADQLNDLISQLARILPMRDEEKAHAVAAPLAAAVDLAAYYEAVRPINERIDTGEYDAAHARAALLRWEYPELIKIKLGNMDRMLALRKRSFDRVNTGAVTIPMGDVSKGFGYAGDISHADENGLTAGMVAKKWDSFTKKQTGAFYLKANGNATAEGLIDVAAFLMEGTVSDKDYEAALDLLSKAAELGADVAPYMKYVEMIKQAQKDFMRPQAMAKPEENPEKQAPNPKTEDNEHNIQEGGKAMTPEILSGVWLVFANPDEVKTPQEAVVVLWVARERAQAQKVELEAVFRQMTAYSRRTGMYWAAVLYMNKHTSEYDLTDSAKELLATQVEQSNGQNPGWTPKDAKRLKATIQMVKNELARPMSANPIKGITDFALPGKPVYDAVAEHREIRPAGRLGCWQLYMEPANPKTVGVQPQTPAEKEKTPQESEREKESAKGTPGKTDGSPTSRQAMDKERLLLVVHTFSNCYDLQKRQELAVVVWTARARAKQKGISVHDLLWGGPFAGSRTENWYKALLGMSKYEGKMTEDAASLVKTEVAAHCQTLQWTRADSLKLKVIIELVNSEMDKPDETNPIQGCTYFSRNGERPIDAGDAKIRPVMRVGCWQLFKEY